MAGHNEYKGRSRDKNFQKKSQVNTPDPFGRYNKGDNYDTPQAKQDLKKALTDLKNIKNNGH